jgi:hypothetical protein
LQKAGLLPFVLEEMDLFLLNGTIIWKARLGKRCIALLAICERFQGREDITTAQISISFQKSICSITWHAVLGPVSEASVP